MPEFDTYHAIERYARNTDDPAAILSYRMLKRRTEIAVMWRAVCNFGAHNLLNTASIQMGAFAADKKQPKPMDMGSMTEKERKDMFMKAVEEVGIQLDPETLAAINKGNEQSS